MGISQAYEYAFHSYIRLLVKSGEIWFNIFTRDVLKGGVWHSKDEQVKQIVLYIKEYNKNRAHPFKWTYTGQALVA